MEIIKYEDDSRVILNRKKEKIRRRRGKENILKIIGMIIIDIEKLRKGKLDEI